MTLTLGALCLAAVAALLNVSVGTNFSAEVLLATLQSATNLQTSSEIFFDCMKAVVPFVLLFAVGQRMWAQAIATAMVAIATATAVAAVATAVKASRRPQRPS